MTSATRHSESSQAGHSHQASGGHGASCNHAHHQPTPIDNDAQISARDLWFSRGGRDLLTGIDLDIRRGEIVTLIGPNGAGKTTLVKLLLGIERPDRGVIHKAPGCRVGYVPQRFDIARALPMTVARFLAMGLKVSSADIDAALREVGGLETRDAQVSNLSGGETQRVLIARALLRDPSLLVLDEPVRGVDHLGEAELYNLISALRDNRKFAVLLVSHDLHVVMAKSDRVVCINHHVCCSGKPEAVSKHPEYARLFGPDAARAFAVYRHEHDHTHDLAGAPGEPTPADRADGVS